MIFVAEIQYEADKPLSRKFFPAPWSW